jgi:hypothetical protein
MASMTSGMTSEMKGRNCVPLTSAREPSVDKTVWGGGRRRGGHVVRRRAGLPTAWLQSG